MKAEYTDMKTKLLVNLYVWGDEPSQLDVLASELISRGVDVDSLSTDVEALITKYGGKV